MIVSQKVLAQALGHVVALVVGYLVSRQGAHVSATSAAEIAGLASVIVGPASGWLAREEPRIIPAAVAADLAPLLAVLAESGTNPRSALHGAVQPVQAPTPVAAIPDSGETGEKLTGAPSAA